MTKPLLIAVPTNLKKIRVGEQFVVTRQFGFNDMPGYHLFLDWLDENEFQRVSERITACFQVNVIVDDFTDAAKIETYLQTH